MIWSTLKSFARITEQNSSMKTNHTLNQNTETYFLREQILFSTERETVFLMEAAFPLQKHAGVNGYSYAGRPL